jgi:predicted helicase
VRHAQVERIRFTGTGTFITRLLQSGLITAADLERKYSTELHANEITLLAYYIAAVNIETTYHALAGKTADADDYQPFPGIVLADTFQISEKGDTLDLEMFAANNDRITRQLATKTLVVLGNPPYSVGQSNANDLNANAKYPTLDGRIEATYAKRSTATNKNSLYDSYIRAFRWATDRIGDSGVVAFVSNGGWIDGNTADGMRRSLADDYSHIYVYNLRGNQRTAGELSRKEGGKIFGGGSRNTVAIFIGVKKPDHAGLCDIHYRDIGDYLSRERKLALVAEGAIHNLDWQNIAPSAEGDWINQRDDTFATWPVMGGKSKTSAAETVFSTYSAGLKTGRDAWCYNFSRLALAENIHNLITQYKAAQNDFSSYCQLGCITAPNDSDVTAYLAMNPSLTGASRISWSAGLKQALSKGVALLWSDAAVRSATYRPFCAEIAYFERQLNDRRYQLPSMFPTPHHTNIGIVLTGPASHFEFTPFITSALPDLHLLDTAQFFPRWTYELDDDAATLDFTGGPAVDQWGYRRIDNITDDILALYRKTAGDQVTKDDVFHYVYGVLHDPDYRTRYAADLKKMLPHIPTPDSAQRFAHVSGIGRQLGDLHVNYEAAEPFPLDVQLKLGTDPANRDAWRVEKMKWRSKTDRSAIVYNSAVTIAGIPDAAHHYMLGSRSGLDWVIDRYQVKTDKASGIVNDPNDWCDEHDDPTYIVDLIKKVTTVSVRTVELIAQLAH